MKILVIIVATAVAVCCISWLVYLFLQKKKDPAEACIIISGFWCCIDLLLTTAFSAVLLSDVDIYQYPSVVYTIQVLFIESFLCGIGIFCYGISIDINYDEIEQDAIS